jgi:hypothetical protein
MIYFVINKIKTLLKYKLSKSNGQLVFEKRPNQTFFFFFTKIGYICGRNKKTADVDSTGSLSSFGERRFTPSFFRIL